MHRLSAVRAVSLALLLSRCLALQPYGRAGGIVARQDSSDDDEKITPQTRPEDHPEQTLPPTITEEQMKDAEPPRDPVDVQNWFGTSLYGFENCGSNKQAIKQAYKDANKLVNVDGVKSNIKWDSVAAFEYFGPPALNKKQQSKIQAVLTNMETVRSGWAPRPFANWIQARCDDPSKRCSINCKGVTEADEGRVRAYSNNPSKINGRDWPFINFCPPFFDMPDLEEAVKGHGSSPYPREKYNVENYISKASTFLHELLHLDLAADSVKGSPNPKIRDLRIQYYYVDKDRQERLSDWRTVYTAHYAKLLARFVPFRQQKTTGYFVQRNVDNFSRFSLAKYIEKRIGNYPFLPQVQEEIDDILVPGPRPDSISLGVGVGWEIDGDHVVLNMTHAPLEQVLPNENGECPEEIAASDDDFTVGMPVADSEYPSWYLEQQKEWLNTIKQSVSSGTCKLDVTEIWTCEPVGSNLYARVVIKSPDGDTIYSTPGSAHSPGQPINDNGPLELQEGGMNHPLKIVGEHKGDYIQFYYDKSSWTTNTKEGDARCKLDGDDWNKDGPGDCGNGAITRKFQCQYPC